MAKKKKQEYESFIARYKWWIMGAILALLTGYTIIYLCFRWNGLLYAGIDLEKRDWLYFLGSYLTFGGTFIVSIMAIMQSQYYAIRQKERDDAERKKQIQPIFSVTLDGINSQLFGTVETVSLYNHNSKSKHKNVTINVENVGEYPVLNVIIFDTYKYPLLKPGEKKSFQCAYEDSPDVASKNKSLIRILKSEYEPTVDGIPKELSICYEDIEGHDMYQTFTLVIYEDTRFYALLTIGEA